MLRRLSVIAGSVAGLLVLALLVRSTTRWLDRRNVARHVVDARAAYKDGRFDEAFKLVKLPSDRGIVEAQALHGRMLYKGQGTSERDYAEAYRLMEPAAAAGDPESQFFLGMMNAQGQARKKDYRAAYDWFTKAALQGHDAALANVGYLYLAGLAVRKDDGAAYGWYLASAARGHKGAVQKVKELRLQLTATEIQTGQRVAAELEARIGPRGR